MRITIDEVSIEEDKWQVALTVTEDDGSSVRMLHQFPVDTLEWRAAEYGIDPDDRATLLDIVLAEPHLTPDELATGVSLYDTPDVDAARRDHLARCAAAKLRLRMSTRTKGSPLDRVRAESVMHPEVLDVKRQQVRRNHVGVAAQRRRSLVPMGARTGADRAAALRQRLFSDSMERVMP